MGFVEQNLTDPLTLHCIVKGTVHPKLKLHPLTINRDVDSGDTV